MFQCFPSHSFPIFLSFWKQKPTRTHTHTHTRTHKGIAWLIFEDVSTSLQALLMTGLRPDEITIALRDANKIADLLPIVEQTLESVTLRS